MSTVVLPLIIILVALGGIMVLVGRRLLAARTIKEPDNPEEHNVASSDDVELPEEVVQPSSIDSVETETNAKKEEDGTSDEDISLGPIRRTLLPPDHSRIKSLMSSIATIPAMVSAGASSISSIFRVGISSMSPVVMGKVYAGIYILGVAGRGIVSYIMSLKRRRAESHAEEQYIERDDPEVTPIVKAEPPQREVPPPAKPPVIKSEQKKKKVTPVAIEKPKKPVPEPSAPKTPVRKMRRSILTRRLPADEVRDGVPALIEEGKTDEAESILVNILSNNPRDIEAYRLLGMVYLKKEEFDQATEVFEEAVRRDPKYVGIHGPLGDCYVVKGKYSKALSAYQRAHEQDEENIEYLEGLLYIATRMDRVPLVQGLVQKILAIDPTHEDAKKAQERAKQRV